MVVEKSCSVIKLACMPVLIAADMSVVYHNGKLSTREASQKLIVHGEKKKKKHRQVVQVE